MVPRGFFLRAWLAAGGLGYDIAARGHSGGHSRGCYSLRDESCLGLAVIGFEAVGVDMANLPAQCC